MRRLWRIWIVVWSCPITWALLAAYEYFDHWFARWVVLLAGFNLGCSLMEWTRRLEERQRR